MKKSNTSLLLFLFLSALSSCNLFRPADSGGPSYSEELFELSPAGSVNLDDRLRRIKMSDLNGRPFTLENLAGRPVFLNFWATWCGPCISEMGSIEEVYQKYGDEVVFLAVSNEAPDEIRAFQEKYPFNFRFARLEVDYLQAFVVKLPTTMLITREGRLLHEEEGFRVWTQYNNLEKIKEIAN